MLNYLRENISNSSVHEANDAVCIVTGRMQKNENGSQGMSGNAAFMRK